MCTPPRSLSQSSNPLELHVVRSTWACQSMIMSCICTRGIGDDYIILGRHLFAPPIPIPAVPKRKGSLRFCCDFACAREASKIAAKSQATFPFGHCRNRDGGGKKVSAKDNVIIAYASGANT